jgi:hypothetical protein
MPLMMSSLLLTASVLSISAMICSQDKKPTAVSKPPQLDKLSGQTIKKWETLRYHLEGAGVKTLTFDIAVTSKGGMTGSWKATGKYQFGGDPKKPYGVLTWEDAEIHSAMQRRGWTASAFAKDIRKDSTLMALANATVTGHPSRGRAILVVKGGKTKEDQTLLFDSAGVQVGEIVGPMKKRINYEIYQGKYLRVGESYQMPETEAALKIQYGTVQKLLLPMKMTEVVKIRKQLLSDLTLVFSNHIVNVKKPGPQPKKPSIPGTGSKAADNKKLSPPVKK